MIDFYQVVAEVLEKNVAGLSMSPEKVSTSLRDLGVDSLDVMIVMFDIQERTGVIISEEAADSLVTPGDIIDFLKSSSVGQL